MVALAIVPALVVAWAYLQSFGAAGSPYRDFTDATTYLAAGDRLNLGHDLYRVRPGDLPVDLYPTQFTVPMVGPPFMAVVARPLAAIDAGLGTWVLACWLSLLGTIAYLVGRVGMPAVMACWVLALPIGEQLAVANVASFFPLLLLAAWRTREHATPGFAIGLMAAAKLAPIAMMGWLLGARNQRAILALFLTLAATGVACLVFAGWANTIDYLRVLSVVGPSTYSVSSAIGVSWASVAVLVGGSLLSVATTRWPRISFIVSILAMTFGTPALYWSGLVALLGVLVPLTDSAAFARFTMIPGRSQA